MSYSSAENLHKRLKKQNRSFRNSDNPKPMLKQSSFRSLLSHLKSTHTSFHNAHIAQFLSLIEENSELEQHNAIIRHVFEVCFIAFFHFHFWAGHKCIFTLSLLCLPTSGSKNTQQLVTESRVNWALDEELRDAILGEHIDL